MNIQKLFLLIGTLLPGGLLALQPPLLSPKKSEMAKPILGHVHTSKTNNGISNRPAPAIKTLQVNNSVPSERKTSVVTPSFSRNSTNSSPVVRGQFNTVSTNAPTTVSQPEKQEEVSIKEKIAEQRFSPPVKPKNVIHSSPATVVSTVQKPAVLSRPVVSSNRPASAVYRQSRPSYGQTKTVTPVSVQKPAVESLVVPVKAVEKTEVKAVAAPVKQKVEQNPIVSAVAKEPVVEKKDRKEPVVEKKDRDDIKKDLEEIKHKINQATIEPEDDEPSKLWLALKPVEWSARGAWWLTKKTVNAPVWVVGKVGGKIAGSALTLGSIIAIKWYMAKKQSNAITGMMGGSDKLHELVGLIGGGVGKAAEGVIADQPKINPLDKIKTVGDATAQKAQALVPGLVKKVKSKETGETTELVLVKAEFEPDPVVDEEAKDVEPGQEPGKVHAVWMVKDVMEKRAEDVRKMLGVGVIPEATPAMVHAQTEAILAEANKGVFRRIIVDPLFKFVGLPPILSANELEARKAQVDALKRDLNRFACVFHRIDDMSKNRDEIKQLTANPGMMNGYLKDNLKYSNHPEFNKKMSVLASYLSNIATFGDAEDVDSSFFQECSDHVNDPNFYTTAKADALYAVMHNNPRIKQLVTNIEIFKGNGVTINGKQNRVIVRTTEESIDVAIDLLDEERRAIESEILHALK